jgi:hypothetical protein
MTRDRATRKQQRPLAVGGACLLGGVLLCLAGPISEAWATPLSGTLIIKGTLTVSTGLPAGTMVSIFANAQVSNAALTDTDSVSSNESVAVSGGQVVFKLVMPYTWPGVATATSVNVQVTVSGSAPGPGTITYNYQSFLTQTIPLPADGVTTKVIFTGSL